jgi:hypothetical protein
LVGDVGVDKDRGSDRLDATGFLGAHAPGQGQLPDAAPDYGRRCLSWCTDLLMNAGTGHEIAEELHRSCARSADLHCDRRSSSNGGERSTYVRITQSR